MASLTIGGHAREIRYSGPELSKIERDIIKAGGRPISTVFSLGGQFAQFELEWLLAGAWKHTLSTERVTLLLAQFYADGGNYFELNQAILEAIIDTGVYGRRVESREEPPVDPPVARASA